MPRVSALARLLDDAPGKSSVRQRLMDASEQLFAEHGWNAVSIRTIVSAAGVNLAALHYHFGSKEQLLSEIFSARAKPIAEERVRLLSEIDLDDAPSLERMLEAFLRPALTIGSDERFGGRAFVKLRARLATEPEEVSRRILTNAFDESSGKFLDALSRALPDLPRADLEWRFHFMLGTMFYTMADAGRIQSLTDGRCDPGRVEDALAHIIPFLAAGFRSKPDPKPKLAAKRRSK
ncbi:TetR/AcrR family transcriptional regulator [Tardiphaga sp. vice352]|uniref:TetR/AcrR family transcriptional regulator n=1 Tax=unclassified Tardiphaga TaxID=2631404 RepID=UPI00116405A6|nr:MULTISPECIES: TetR/AcrR family transcriptional regulator [unclassified Tardiphaga]MBC7579091.1 TetR/AcrR family transcriptional regulator [Tardiphaga sp.]QDM14761.1 TetR/AcrR family transcriptional regulator [Tardiphaga sp. vice278]QDM24941.1 TetR/AcrR family transcriptional regulator [Tardiphaga sp. vice304]QDM30151.1 TetR/AcrR family transcriptional regulator [Tardiphaga sp. vice352]